MIFPTFVFIHLVLMAAVRLSKGDATSVLNDAMTRNAKQFFLDSSSARSSNVIQTREQTMAILLNQANMKAISPNEISDSFIAKELNVTKRLVSKFRNNETAFKDIMPAVKSKGLSPNAFIYKHNELAQLIPKFWIEHSTSSPNKKDVVTKHSTKPGEHCRVKPGDGKANFIRCTTRKCKTDQRRYAMGRDYKLYLKFLATYKDKYPNLAKTVTKWRFRSLKPFFIRNAEQQ